MRHQRLINLTFHGVGEPTRPLDDGEAGVWVGTDAFTALLDAAVGRPDVRITFDDGNASDAEIALPALTVRGLTATFFVVAGRVGTPGFLDAPQIQELVAAGMRIGNHGMRHQPWRGLDDAGLTEELGIARRVLEDVVGAPVDEAACPFGSYDRRVLTTLRRTGYRHVYTSDRGTVAGDEWLQARNTITPDDTTAVLDAIAAPVAPVAALAGRAKLTLKRWR
ncbi:MAG TPA: polysaccharide deacetylase family protein [Baekduia sp.]|nr:polysaccharide deacetylase family protein [Baekduia sp.]